MPVTLTMNGVAKKRNRFPKEMVRSMISHFTLLESLWGEVFKTVTYILNRVQQKATNNKTPYELWTIKMSILYHFHIWGCPTKAQPYSPILKRN